MAALTSKPDSNRRLRAFLFGLLGIAIFAVLLYFARDQSLDRVLHPSPTWLILMMITIAVAVFIFSYRLGLIASSLAGRRVMPHWQLYFSNVSSLAAAILVPQTLGLMVVRAAALNRLGGIPLSKSVTAVLFDKLFDALMMALFACPGFLFLLKILTMEQVILISFVEIVLTAGLLIWRFSFVLRVMERLVTLGVSVLSRIPLLRRSKNLQSMQQLKAWDILHQQVILQSFCLTVVGQLGLVIRSWSIAHAIGLDIGLSPVFIGVALAQFMQLIAFTPGAIGLVEAAWYLVFASSGVTGEQILGYVIAHRVFENVSIIFIWIILYFYVLLAKRTSFYPPTHS